ncbi:hypothetical protein [Salibacter sp.]|jgi:cytochrome c556|uniref:hypothetical protein n=1 Tax=Salibacter sp. TaxID=2010995 RepID=UPI002870216C|nr:hypothetical protein [Salibacter sp.]MDR9398237.1 hypothetical protein [Salibacter sp.]MDR9487459.1 hypothetical protein [Salibacter sp.]
MKKIITGVAILALAACGNSSSKKKDENQGERKKLMEEVMALHDKYMPQMDSLKNLNNRLGTQLDSAVTDSTMTIEFENARTQLENASEGMMNWMRNFEKPADSVKTKKAINYLNDQKKLMENVGIEMEQSMHRADSLLNHSKK